MEASSSSASGGRIVSALKALHLFRNSVSKASGRAHNREVFFALSFVPIADAPPAAKWRTDAMTVTPTRWLRLRAVLIALLVIAIPVIAALKIADYQSHREMERQAVQLVHEVLQRSHRISAQIMLARAALTEPGLRPCSDAYQRRMTQINMENPLLIGMGYVEGDQLLCSTFSKPGQVIPLGPADYLSRTHNYLRVHAQLPGVTNQTVVISTEQSSGFTAIVHPDTPVDFLNDELDLSMGVYNELPLKTVIQRGEFLPAWNNALKGQTEAHFFDGQYFVALERSQLYDYIAYAALPVQRMGPQHFSLVLILVPVGIGAGGALVLLLLRLYRHQASLATQLRSALKRNQLYLVYQPVVDLKTGRWCGVEALVRWKRPDGQITPPDIFIPAAEYAGLITQITKRVCELCVHDLMPLLLADPHFHVSVNFSAADFSSPDTLSQMQALLSTAGLDPRQFQIEATERVLVDQAAIEPQLATMRALGLRLAIDDFGTGYSNLAYLTSLAANILKIDKLFVETIGTDAATSQVVAHIIEMAKSLNLVMVAEGVETQAQADYLQAHGVQYAQGWHFARPMSAQALAEGLAAQALHKSKATLLTA
jgi:sensor c-di-GMP phosphodiesterase-like protein